MSQSTQKVLLATGLLMVGIEEILQLGAISAPLSVEFSNELDNLDSGFALTHEMNKLQWVDGFHLSLEPKGVFLNGTLAGVALINLTLS